MIHLDHFQISISRGRAGIVGSTPADFMFHYFFVFDINKLDLGFSLWALTILLIRHMNSNGLTSSRTDQSGQHARQSHDL
jgi:hypothetical protein